MFIEYDTIKLLPTKVLTLLVYLMDLGWDFEESLLFVEDNLHVCEGSVLLAVLMNTNVTGESWHEVISAQWGKRHHTGPTALLFSRPV